MHAPRHQPGPLPSGGSPWTLLGPGSLVRGDLVLTGDVMLYGRLEGSLFTDGTVWVGSEAVVEGGIHARSIVIEGCCRGRLEALERITLRSGAALHGEAVCEVVHVEPGARFTGWRSDTKTSSLRVEPYRSPNPGTA